MRMTIRKKLYGGFGVILLLFMLVSLVNINRMMKVEDTYQGLVEQQAASVSLVKDLSLAIRDENISISTFLQSGSSAEIEYYRKAVNRYNNISDKLEPIIDKTDKWQILMGLDLLQQQYTSNMEQVIELKLAGNQAGYEKLMGSSEPIIQKFRETAERFVALQETELSDSVADTSKETAMTFRLLSIITGALILLSMGIAFWIARLITRPVQQLSQAAEQIASGDLTHEDISIQSQDEIGVLSASFNQMSRNLRKLITQMSESAEHVAASSQQLTAGAEHTTKATEQVVQIIEQTAAGAQAQIQNVHEGIGFVRHLSQDAGHIAESAQEVSEKAAFAADVSEQGSHAIRSAVEQMNLIHQTVEGIVEEVSRLGRRSAEIGEIVGVISGIASQTNLLALNAAIEAARAGEAGRGFAVVASEIRRLADQSSRSGNTITELVKAIQQDTEQTVAAVRAGIGVVETGLRAVGVAGDSFQNIQEAVQTVSGQIQAVSASSQKMSSDTETLVTTMEAIQVIADETSEGTTSVSAASQEQLATMEEISSSSGDLTRMSEKLLDLVSSFKV